MSEQLELFAIVEPETIAEATIEERFLAFHEANPHVYRSLVALARQMRAGGRARVSIKLLIERLRWEYAMRTTRPEGEYAINNDYTSRYARLIMASNPDLAGIFELRRLREPADA